MKYPTGKYNGRRIGGFTIKVEFNVLWWAVYINLWGWTKCIHIGPVHIWFETAYEK